MSRISLLREISQITGVDILSQRILRSSHVLPSADLKFHDETNYEQISISFHDGSELRAATISDYV